MAPSSRPIAVCEQKGYILVMSSTQFIIQIQSWDWPLHVGLKPHALTHNRRPDGGFLCSAVVVIDGLILLPEERRSKIIQLRLYPLAREVIGSGHEDLEVGRLNKNAVEGGDFGFSASLFLPEDMLQNVLLCLSSKWQCVYLWVDEGVESHAVTDFGFSGAVDLHSHP